MLNAPCGFHSGGRTSIAMRLVPVGETCRSVLSSDVLRMLGASLPQSGTNALAVESECEAFADSVAHDGVDAHTRETNPVVPERREAERCNLVHFHFPFTRVSLTLPATLPNPGSAGRIPSNLGRLGAGIADDTAGD